jgi:hypothetical protein
MYKRYYRPRFYSFDDVAETIRVARRRGLFTSINYLTFPGFTDSRREVAALKRLIDSSGLDMIQWRNLNIDPDAYCAAIELSENTPAIGLKSLAENLARSYPALRHGYVNPPRETWQAAVVRSKKC